MLNKVHHINLLVRDLDRAVARYREALGVCEFILGELPGRGVRTARFRAGESWIVLVQPTDPDGVPGRQLAEHGEGLFLLSFEVDSLPAALERVQACGESLLSGPPRAGLEDWYVADLAADEFFGAQLQLAEEAGRERE